MLTITAVLLLGLFAWLGRQRWQALTNQLLGLQQRLQNRWQASETFAWRNLQRALRGNPLPLAELYRWQLRSQGVSDLQLLINRLPPEAATCLHRRLRQQYAAPATCTHSGDKLRPGLRQLRKQLRRNSLFQASRFRLQPLNRWPATRPDSPCQPPRSE